jgi:hypothetical protein
MPYTFSHIGYVLPLKKRWSELFSTTGLVFGSIAPDYDILFRWTQNRFHIFQYDLWTILFLITPLAWLSAISFHLLCRDEFILHLPEPFASRYCRYVSADTARVFRKNAARITCSIVFAIMLHLLLDYLCHYYDAFTVEMYVLVTTQSELAAQVAFYIALYFLPVVFSIAGFYFMYCYFRNEHIDFKKFRLPSEKHVFWQLVAVCTLLIGLIKFYFIKHEPHFIFDLIAITFTSSFILSAYIVSAMYVLKTTLQKKKLH